MNYFSQKYTFFLILQLWLAPFFNFSPLSDLNYNLPQISGKIIFFREKIGFFRFFAEKSAIFLDFSTIFFQTIFPPEFLFHQHRKTKFRRKIGRNFRNFCPCLHHRIFVCQLLRPILYINAFYSLLIYGRRKLFYKGPVVNEKVEGFVLPELGSMFYW